MYEYESLLLSSGLKHGIALFMSNPLHEKSNDNLREMIDSQKEPQHFCFVLNRHNLCFLFSCIILVPQIKSSQAIYVGNTCTLTLKTGGGRYISIHFNIIISLTLSFLYSPEPALTIPALRGTESQNERRDLRNSPNSIKEMFDGFLWAVPKHRRSIERNRGRRRATDKRVSYNESLVPCETCGNLRQFGYLCG